METPEGGSSGPGREQRLRELLHSAALESAANAIFITDVDGRIEYVNPAFERLTGYRAAEAIGRSPRILKSGRQSPEFYQDFWRTIRRGEVWHGRVVNRRQDGELFTVTQTVTPVAAEGGQVTHFVAIHEDISHQIEAERRIQYLARHDYLTDLPNRYTLQDRLERETVRAVRKGGRIAVLMLDLDNFKGVNDGFGHATGDALLVAVALRLKEAVREVDTVARLGGDEFAVIAADLPSAERAAELAERLLASLAVPFDLENHRVYTTGSVGIAISPPSQPVPEELLQQADLALYRAKEEGRNGYRFFVEEMHREIQLRLALGQELHGALERDELYLAYQPQVDLRSRRIVGVEALLRWRHPHRGLVMPSEFVPIAERTGQIVSIGEWVLRTACTQVKAWQNSGLPVMPIAVNLSAVQLRDRHFVDLVVRTLEETGLAPGLLELELTETILLEASPGLEEILDALSERGVRLSLDDFGRGYSSLEYLRRLPLSKLKIDQSFVRDVRSNLRDATILSAVIALAVKLDLDVVAEGVEPGTRLDFLLEEGCDEVQGFFFSEPLPAESFAELLREGRGKIEQLKGDEAALIRRARGSTPPRPRRRTARHRGPSPGRDQTS